MKKHCCFRRICNWQKSFGVFLLMVILSSCGQNFHLTGFKLDAGVTLPAGGVEVGQNYNLEGDCEPNGATVTLESPDFTPSPVTATCVDGRYRVADPVQFTGSGPNGTNPKIMVSIDDGRGPPVEREEVTLINNTLPVIADDNANTTFGNAVTVDVDLNDSDPDGTLNLPGMSILTQPPVSEGVCALTGAPNYDITFTPAANFAGNSSCVYELCDNAGLCDQASLTVTVDPGATPVATDDTANTPYNTPVTVDVQLNDTDNNLDPSSTSITVQPPVAQGVCAVGAAPNYDVTFTPVAGFEGVSSCTYQICDLNSPNAQCDTATISVTVAAGVAPVANNDTSSGLFGAAQTIDPLPNDTDANGDIDNTSVTIDTNANTATEGTCTAASPNVTFTPVANFAGNATCTYQVCDDTARCDTADIVFTVAPGAAPVATDDTGSGNFGDPIVVDVQGNDTDADGNFDPSSTTIATQPPVAEGVCAVGTAPNYDVTFTPATGFNGNSTCTYSICDANMPTPQCDTADVVFTVGAGSAPVANNDTVTTDPNVAVATDVSANDTDADGNLDNTSVTLVGTQPNAATEGSCSVASPNVTFTPVAAYLGGDLVCEYQICDSNSPTPQCDTASLTITVDGDPAATDDTGSGTFGTPVVVDVQANDTEPNGDLDPSTTTISTQPPVAEGVCAVGAAPNYDVTFTPATNFAGTSTCTYQICDGSTPANCDTADITITVGAGSAPVATDDTGSGNFGDPIAVDVQGNDTDADGNLDPSSTTISTQPPVAEGVCAVGGAPNYDVTFTPATGFNGNSTCTYSICDANMPTPQCDTADVVFTVGAGSAPVANNDTVTTDPNVAVATDVSANDTDADGNLDNTSVTLVGTQPNAATEGSCSVASPNVTFTPVAAYLGGDLVCEYQICDSNSPTPQCDTASLTITVDGDPAATDDTGSGTFGTPVVVDVQANDTEPNGDLDPSTTTISTQPPVAEGVCAVGAAPNYDVTFTPATNFAGTSTCTYQICDGSTPANCDTADITITVGAGSAPVATDDTGSGNFGDPIAVDVQGNDTDADGNLDPSSTTISTQPPVAEGVCAVGGAPNYDVTFTPAANFTGNSTCTYQVCDANMPTPQCDTADVVFTVGTGSAPVAGNDVGAGTFGQTVTVDVQANDTDADGNLDPSSTTIDTQPPVAEGVCSVGAAPAYDVSFVPASGFNGTSSCVYEICDANIPTPQCDTASLTVTIGSGSAPLAGDDVGSGNFGDPIVVDVQANDTDPDGNLDPSSTSIDTQPPVTEGVCAVGAAPNYDITFTPAANYAGNSTCTYEICDLNTPTPQCDTADVVFTVGAGAAPVANDDTATTDPNVAVATNVATNDTDADGNLDNTSVTLVGGQPNAATEGSCSVASPNVTFTPCRGLPRR